MLERQINCREIHFGWRELSSSDGEESVVSFGDNNAHHGIGGSRPRGISNEKWSFDVWEEKKKSVFRETKVDEVWEGKKKSVFRETKADEAM